MTSGLKKASFFRRALLPWLSVIAWAAVIYYISDQPSLTIAYGFWDFILRKGAHITEFIILSLLVWNAVRQHVGSFTGSLAVASGLSFLYACSDEYHQMFVAGREGTVRDVAIDTIGIAIAAIAIFLLMSRSGKERNDGPPEPFGRAKNG